MQCAVFALTLYIRHVYVSVFVSSLDAVIAIERPGPGSDGTCWTMRALSMNHLLAPLELLFHDTDKHVVSVGIGDGGNELGMGKVLDRILASTVPNASTIACTVASDHLLVCSVSNWGGYAMAAAVSLMHVAKQKQLQPPGTGIESVPALPPPLPMEGAASMDGDAAVASLFSVDSCLSSSEEQLKACEALVAAGARDGITKEQKIWVDGFPLQTSLDVLEELNAIVREATELLQGSRLE